MRVFALLTFLLPALAFAAADKEGIRAKIKEHLKEVRGCYDEPASKNPSLKGKIIIDWSVDDTGKVTQAKVDEAKTTLKDPTVQSCLTDKFKSWTFPPAPKGQVVTASYPFVFSK
jgi:hypothetical protein